MPISLELSGAESFSKLVRQMCLLALCLCMLMVLFSEASSDPHLSISYHYNIRGLEGACVGDFAAANDIVWIGAHGCGSFGSFAYLLKTDRSFQKPQVIEPLTDRNTVQCYIHSISFIDERIGWFLMNCSSEMKDAGSTLYRTENGGKTWTKEFGPEKRISLARKIQFIDRSNGWMLSSVNRIYLTKDGGVSWGDVRLPVSSLTTRDEEARVFSRHTTGDLAFVNKNHGWVSGPWDILHTKDGGESWQVQYDTHLEPAKIVSLSLLNEMEGWGCGIGQRGPKLVRTTNGGERWNEVEVRLGEVRLTDRFDAVLFVNSKVGLVAGSHYNQEYDRLLARGENLEDLYFKFGGSRYFQPYLIYTADGGQNWQYHPLKISVTKWLKIGDTVYGVGEKSAIVEISLRGGQRK